MCLAIPGQIVEVVDEPNRLGEGRRGGRPAHDQHRPAGRRRRRGRPGRLGADPRRLRDLAGRRGGGDRHPPSSSSAWARTTSRARGAEGERDRVSASATAATTASPARDEGVPMEVLSASTSARGLALCAAEDGAKSTVEIALVAPVEPGDRRARARRRGARGAERTVRFVDEFRDPELGRVLAGGDPRRRRAGPPLQVDGGLRRPHALDLQVRRRRPAARRTSSSCTGPAARSA